MHSINKSTRTMMLVFTAGCAGGLANSIMVWLFGVWGITKALGVSIAPIMTPEWLYPRIVWGGIWGWIFLLPLLRQKPLARGLLLSLGPTLVQLFIVFPLQAHKGFLGTDLGAMTPLCVLLFNAAWGVTAALLLALAMPTRRLYV